MKETYDKPPKWAIKFLRWFCDNELLEDVEGDLTENYEKTKVKGAFRANWLFTLEVLKLFRPGIIRSLEGQYTLNHYGMLKNYVVSSFRNLRKHKRFAFINIFSLTLGICACIVVYLFVNDERSFDAIHSKGEQIYRLCEIQSFTGTNTQKVALTMPGMGPTMAKEFLEINKYSRFWSWGEQLAEVGDEKYLINKVVGVDTAFFDIFDFNVIYGNRESLIQDSFDAVLTEKTAIRLFGKVDVIGESIVLKGDPYIIKGVIADLPENSHLQFDMLLSLFASGKEEQEFNTEFGSNYMSTYLELTPNADLSSMSERFPDYLVRASGRENINEGYELFLQPLKEVHLASSDIEHDYHNYRKFNGVYITLFIIIGTFIIVIASVNFMNLTMARASGRAKEVGVRKAIGATRNQLFFQFLLESTIMSLLALLLAFVLVAVCLPFLNEIIDRKLSILTALSDIELILFFLFSTLLLGMFSGLVPAWYLSSFKPVFALKNMTSAGKPSVFNNVLVVLQFSLALAMIVSTFVVLQQLNFMKNRDIGFQKEHILLVDLNAEAREKYTEMKNALLKKSNVLGVTGSGQRLGSNFHQWGFKARKDTGIISVTPSNVLVDYNYLDVYGIKLLEGRNFSRDYGTDDGLAFIINESFAKELGYADPIGQRVGHSWYADDSLGTIIGVTEDFNFNSLHYKVNTLSMVVHSEWEFSEMSVKLNAQNMEQAIQDVEEVYYQFVMDYPFKYEFLDDHFADLYKSDQQMASVISIVAVLSILIGCMGLFGLASVSIERRIKEIGIRKILGASIKDLVFLLTRNFGYLILISFVIATPFTWIYLADWLESFAFRIVLDPFVFIVGGLLAMIVALITIGFRVLRATKLNPVDSLRYE